MKAFIFAALGLTLGTWAHAQSSSSPTLASYTIEIAPTVGINLPYDIWGISGTLSTYGVQAAYAVGEAGAFTVSGLYHSKGNDWAWTLDSGYRHEISSHLFNAYFDIGFHYSNFHLTVDRDADGYCVPANCQTDSGGFAGAYGGSGVVIPLAPLTLVRVGFRFYNNPQAWVLLSSSLGIRF